MDSLQIHPDEVKHGSECREARDGRGDVHVTKHTSGNRAICVELQSRENGGHTKNSENDKMAGFRMNSQTNGQHHEQTEEFVEIVNDPLDDGLIRMIRENMSERSAVRVIDVGDINDSSNYAREHKRRVSEGKLNLENKLIVPVLGSTGAEHVGPVDVGVVGQRGKTGRLHVDS